MGRKGISPLIASVFVILFGVTMLGISLGVINPTFRRAKDTAIVNDAFHTLETLNTAIKEVASEPDGSKRVVPIVVSEGTLRVNTTYDWLYFDYDPMETLTISGTKGDIHIVRGLEFADWFNYYADGSAATPTWTNISGQAAVSSGAYSITNGTSYRNVSGPLENWKFSASISNVSGPTGGQVFVLPTNPESLVGFWPFDNRSGSVAYDYSGKRNNGTLTNMNTTGNETSGWTTDAKFGTALKFDGVNDLVNAGSGTDFILSQGGSLGAWFKINKLASSWGNTIIMKGDGASWANIHYSLFENSGTDKILLAISNGTHSLAGSGPQTASIVVDTWYHVVGTWNSTTKCIYLNGILQQCVVSDIMPKDTMTSCFVNIGRTYSNSYYFNGTIDEVMSFNRSLSGDEIQALYETSAKKLLATGTQSITAKTTPAIMLSNPAGKTSFDDVTVVRERNELKMIVPYANVDLNGTLRLSKGEHKVQIRHMDTNDATSRPIVEITAA